MGTVVSVGTRTKTPNLGHMTGADALEDIQHVTDLLSLSQTLCGQLDGGVEYLCHEVAHITQGRVKLCVSRQKFSKRVKHSSHASLVFPIQFRNTTYGALLVENDMKNTDSPALPHSIIQHLAQICSWLLYTLEQAAFLEGQCQQLDSKVNITLTKREREVVLLMCRGYTQDEIAESLSISPSTVRKHKQHIYDQLGVHNEREALLMAYHTGLFSIVDERF